MSALLTLALTAAAAAPSGDAPRVVALGGPITEIVYALGADDQIVGVDKSSLYPKAATERPQVGYFRGFSAEGVLSLKPDLVLAMDGSGPPPALAALRKAGVRVVEIGDAQTVDEATARIRAVAAALGRAEAGDRLVKTLRADLGKLSKPGGEPPRVLFVYARGGGTLNVAGTGNAADAMIRLVGGVNAMTSYEGFRPLTAEAVVAAKPDVILLTDRGLGSLGGQAGFLKTPGVALTPAAKSGRIVSLPDLLLLGFGPRLGEAAVQLQAKLRGPGDS